MSKIVEQHIPCPSCSSSDAYCTYDDGHGYCFSCSFYLKPNSKEFMDDAFTYEYLPLRGINKDALRHYDVKTKIDKDGKPVAQAYVYPNGSIKVRNLIEKDFHSKGEISKAGLFGRNRFDAGSHKYITITEGELDALSIWQTLGVPAVSVQSAGTAVRDCSTDWSFLNSFERVYLAFDSDTPGRAAVADVAKLFDFDKVYDVRFSRHKDANAYLVAGDQDELRNVWWNAKRYKPENILSRLDEFKAILAEPPKRGVAFPWKTLDDMTYGIHRGKTYLITAQEGIGKTEVMHAIEYQLLKATEDRIGCLFLEEDSLRHLQALAGLELGCPAHLPDSGCTVDEVRAAIDQVVGSDDRLHVVDHYGSDDPEQLLENIRYLVSACGCSYILLDHITMVVSGGSENDERRTLDRVMTKLEMMVKELNFALVVVSHVNDFNQTRGSRYIGKIAHVRIDLKRDHMSEDPIKRNTTQLYVSKNRYGRKTGPAGELFFNLDKHCFEELYHDEAANDNYGVDFLVA